MALDLEFILNEQLQDLMNKDYSEIGRTLVIKSMKKKATVLTGIRRAGKSTLLKRWCLENKTHLPPLYISFFDERLINFKVSELNNFLEAFASIHGGLKPEIIFFDEIQLVEGWEYFIARLIENPSWRVFLTGSSAKLLSREIASQMRGRALSFELFPFSFYEYLQFKKIDTSNLDTSKRGQIKRSFHEYLKWGGFPEIVGSSLVERRKVLNEYLEVLLFRDIVERNQFERTAIARRLLVGLIKMYGNLFSLNQTHKKLRAEGLFFDKGTLSDFLRWCEDAYILFSIPLYTESDHKARINPQKIYICDIGLAQACEVWNESLRGKRFENLVFVHLRASAKYKRINYYLSQSKYEVDFICQDEKEKLTLIQVCWEFNEESNGREVRALEQAMEELSLKKSFIITFNQNEVIKVSSGEIHLIDLFKFFLTPLI